MPAFTKENCISLAKIVLWKSRTKAIKALKKVERLRPGMRQQPNTWENSAYKLRQFIQWKVKTPPFSIFAEKGNSKLGPSIVAFSSLPGFDCPGAGACLFYDRGEFAKGWCYSFKAWRYPLAFFRQLQNSWLLRNEREKVARAFQDIKEGSMVR